jgi:adenylate kinase family enzyme
MKKKFDFITNSSSASFILYVKSTTNDLEEFKILFERYLDHFFDENFYRISEKITKYKEATAELKKSREELEEKIKINDATKQEISLYNMFYKNQEEKELSEREIKKVVTQSNNVLIDKLLKNTFEITYWTSMLNDVLEDCPDWMIKIILENNIDPKKLIQFGIKEVRLKVEDDI